MTGAVARSRQREIDIESESTMASEADSARLRSHGARELVALFHVVAFHSAANILVFSADGVCTDASIGLCRLLGVSPKRMIGEPLSEFLEEKSGAPLLPGPDQRDLASIPVREIVLRCSNGLKLAALRAIHPNVRPEHHLLVLPESFLPAPLTSCEPDALSAWSLDYALFLTSPDGRIVSWYSGAERLFGYAAEEAVGKHDTCLLPDLESSPDSCAQDSQCDPTNVLSCCEGLRKRKDGSHFWANVVSKPLRNDGGTLMGFARVARNFDKRQERMEWLRRQRGRIRPLPAEPHSAGLVSITAAGPPELNPVLLEMLGYTPEDFLSGDLQWPDLTPPSFAPLDALAHEEELLFGASAPYEKELIAKDGTHIPVLVISGLLRLAPLRWICFAQDLRERNRVESLESTEPTPSTGFEEMVGASASLKRVVRQIEVVAPTDATVLILGETGTGKELVARAIHRLSPRRLRPFISLNCAAIPTGLLESELFGYERGAFTGALTQKVGRFEMANGGTLFLDEVGDIPLDLQPKLLRALQEKSFERLGGSKTIPINVRLIAATNRDLSQMMEDKLFRSDLFYRLKVFPITTPPLRDRPEDIPVLARHFTKLYSERFGRGIQRIPAETMRAMVAWPWPGNIRELENFIERSVILSTGTVLHAPLQEIKKEAAERQGSSSLERVERDHVLKVLRESGGVVTLAATRLGLHRTTLNALMRRLNISRKDI